MKITGELLKTERLNQGLGLQDIAQALKLSQKIIAAIELGDDTQLPAKTFIRGFVKSYAQFLKLDTNVVLRQFQEEMGTTSPLPKTPPPMAQDPSASIKAQKPSLRQTAQNYSPEKSITSQAIREQGLAEKKFNNKILFFLIGAASLVIFILLATKFITSTDPIQPNLSDNTAQQVIAPNYTLPDSANLNDVSATTQISSDASTNPVNASNSVPVDTPQTNTEKIVTEVVVLPQDDMPPTSGKPVELVLEAKRDIEIFYARGNTRQFKSLKLISNKIQILRSSTGIHIKAADGGAFKITANGVDQGIAGTNNKPIKVSF